MRRRFASDFEDSGIKTKKKHRNHCCWDLQNLPPTDRRSPLLCSHCLCRTREHRNKCAGRKLFKPDRLSLFFCAIAYFSLAFRMSLRCSAVVLVSLLFRSEQNKLIWIVSCNPAIRLFRFTRAIGTVRSKYSGDYRIATTYCCRSLLLRISKGSETLFRGFQRRFQAQKRVRECIFRRAAASGPCVFRVELAPPPSPTAIKSHLLTEFEEYCV